LLACGDLLNAQRPAETQSLISQTSHDLFRTQPKRFDQGQEQGAR
jgi:hypothetical protein